MVYSSSFSFVWFLCIFVNFRNLWGTWAKGWRIWLPWKRCFKGKLLPVSLLCRTRGVKSFSYVGLLFFLYCRLLIMLIQLLALHWLARLVAVRLFLLNDICFAIVFIVYKGMGLQERLLTSMQPYLFLDHSKWNFCEEQLGVKCDYGKLVIFFLHACELQFFYKSFNFLAQDPTDQVAIDNLMVQQLDGTVNEWGWCKQKVAWVLLFTCLSGISLTATSLCVFSAWSKCHIGSVSCCLQGWGSCQRDSPVQGIFSIHSTLLLFQFVVPLFDCLINSLPWWLFRPCYMGTNATLSGTEWHSVFVIHIIKRFLNPFPGRTPDNASFICSTSLT